MKRINHFIVSCCWDMKIKDLYLKESITLIYQFVETWLCLTRWWTLFNCYVAQSEKQNIVGLCALSSWVSLSSCWAVVGVDVQSQLVSVSSQHTPLLTSLVRANKTRSVQVVCDETSGSSNRTKLRWEGRDYECTEYYSSSRCALWHKLSEHQALSGSGESEELHRWSRAAVSTECV